MKVILSRKGFDSSYGGFPSIILPNGQMISFPIPETHEERGGVNAEELKYTIDNGEEENLKKIFSELGINTIKNPSDSRGTKIDDTIFHFDPEIPKIGKNKKVLNYAAFGQSGAACKHLKKYVFDKKDKDEEIIFLFFGTFKETRRENTELKYDDPMNEIHAIWGYMIVDDFIDPNKIDEEIQNKYEDIDTHLHSTNKKKYVDEQGNPLDNIIICGTRFGTFKFNPQYHQLTKKGYRKSFWELPSCFKGASVSYCTEKLEDPKRFQSASIGQEFVVTNFDEKEMKQWLDSLGVNFEINKKLCATAK